MNLNNLYTQMNSAMLAQQKCARDAFTHPGSKGDETEAGWIDWFTRYLPKRYAVTKGIVIDSYGNESNQIDVVIYDTQYSHFVFNQNDTPIIPAESVYAVFEVKQELNKTHMEYASEKASSVRNLKRTSAPIRHAGGYYKPKELHEIVAGLLTTECEWLEPVASNVAKYIHGNDYTGHLDLVCSLSTNTFVVENRTFLTEEIIDPPRITHCEKGECLVFLLLSLLQKLQDIGTVPAIDFAQYAQRLNITKYVAEKE